MKNFEWTVANVLTLLRLVLAPFVGITFAFDLYWASFTLFVLAAGSDLVDGTIARMMGQRSEWGAFIDPIADKSLMLISVFCLMWVRMLPDWFFALVFIKDASVLGGLWYMNRRHIEIKMEPIWWSKWNTLLLITTTFLGFLCLTFPSLDFLQFPLGDFKEGFMWVTAGFTTIVTLKYVRRGLEILAEHTPV